mmetsp:Transcript_22882/g.71954  ORF Transcript_22882/g.71954 Transcript_22882/m.71954 type:complete len:110 (+) Transcript_22882:573-902(+)
MSPRIHVAEGCLEGSAGRRPNKSPVVSRRASADGILSADEESEGALTPSPSRGGLSPIFFSMPGLGQGPSPVKPAVKPLSRRGSSARLSGMRGMSVGSFFSGDSGGQVN